MTEFHELARSVGAAMEKMGTVSLGNVSVLLTDTPPVVDDEYGHTMTLDAQYGAYSPARKIVERECQIAFFKGARATSPEAFFFALSHELFHCMQYRLWEGQMAAGLRAGRDTGRGLANAGWWWIEGTAHYFAYLSRPGAAEYDPSLLPFDQSSVRTSLYEMMSYDTAVFFAWWGQTRGHSAIPAFIAQMPSRPSPRQEQLEALRRVVTSDEWSEFSRAYLDRNIQLPGGRLIPSNPQQGEPLRISDAGEFPLPTTNYVVERRPIIFAPGRAYNVSFEGRPADARIKWAASAGTGWSDPPATVLACESEAQFREVRSTSSSDTAGVMRVSIPDRDTNCNCVVGEWRMTEPSLLENLRRRAHRSVESHTIVSGRLYLIFNPDATPTSLGTGRYVHENLVYRSQHRPESGTSLVETALKDSSPIFWGTGVGSLMIAFQNPSRRPEGTVNTSTYMRRPHVPNSRGEDGVTLPVTKKEPLLLAVAGVGPLLGGSTYQCSGNNLHIESTGYPDGTHTFDFVRISSPTR
ncbi:hypothetical protein B0B52_14075 [Polaromonas sp. A23]|nr:hypothetical protein B0B52_14075 [Polaromonas sp. A23]